VRRKGSDRVDGKVDSRDSEDDEGKQENSITRGDKLCVAQRVYSCGMYQVDQFPGTQSSHGAAVWWCRRCVSGDCHGDDVPWKCLVILSGIQATDTDAHDFTTAADG
jgi:hypothetical protein